MPSGKLCRLIPAQERASIPLTDSTDLAEGCAEGHEQWGPCWRGARYNPKAVFLESAQQQSYLWL